MQEQHNEALPQDLDFLLGVGGSGSPRHTIIEVNNSKEEIEIPGRTEKVKVLNDKGGFVKIAKDETGEYQSVPFASSFSGVILAVRAYCEEPFENKDEHRWYTKEFNPLDADELISVFKGKAEIFRGTYRDIKARNSKKNTVGEQVNNFDYWLVLYVLVNQADEQEIVRLKVKGNSRSNFFDYKTAVYNEGKNFRGYETVFATYQVNGGEIQYHAAKYVIGKESDRLAMDQKAHNLYKQFTAYKSQQALAAPAQPAIEAPKPVVNPLAPEVELPTIDLVPEEEEIRIEDIPF